MKYGRFAIKHGWFPISLVVSDDKWEGFRWNINGFRRSKWVSEEANGSPKKQMGLWRSKWVSEEANGSLKKQMGLRRSKWVSEEANGSPKKQMGLRRSKWVSKEENGSKMKYMGLWWKKLSLYQKHIFSHPYIFVQPDGVTALDYFIYRKSWFEIFKVYDIGLLRNRDKKFRFNFFTGTFQLNIGFLLWNMEVFDKHTVSSCAR